MKKILLTALVAISAQMAAADDFKYLTIYDKDGKATDIELSALQKITFTATDMVALTTDGEKTFSLANLLKMAFAMSPTPIDAINATTAGKLLFDGASIVVGPEAKGQTLAVYAQNGTLLAQQKVGKDGASLSLAALPKGVYVVCVGNTAVKIAK